MSVTTRTGIHLAWSVVSSDKLVVGMTYHITIVAKNSSLALGDNSYPPTGLVSTWDPHFSFPGSLEVTLRDYTLYPNNLFIPGGRDLKIAEYDFCVKIKEELPSLDFYLDVTFRDRVACGGASIASIDVEPIFFM